MQILQFLKTFRAQVPVSGPERYFSILTNFPLMFPAFGIYQTELNVRRSPGGLYYLSYLDRDMLLGRSIGGGGVFIFTRAQPLVWRFSGNQENIIWRHGSCIWVFPLTRGIYLSSKIGNLHELFIRHMNMWLQPHSSILRDCDALLWFLRDYMQHVFFLYTSCGESWVVDPKASWNSSILVHLTVVWLLKCTYRINISISKTNVPCVLLEDIDFFVVYEMEFHLIS